MNTPRTIYNYFWADMLQHAYDNHSRSDCDWILSVFSKDHLTEQLGLSDLQCAVIEFKTLEHLENQLNATPRTAIDEQDYLGRTALSLASGLAEIDIVKRLLQRGANPNITDIYGRTSLH